MFTITPEFIEKIKVCSSTEEKTKILDGISFLTREEAVHSFLHITDIHYHKGTKGRKRLDKSLPSFKKSAIKKITGCILTGDIIDSSKIKPTGHKDVYEMVKDDLTQLEFEKKQVLIIPGNHDCVSHSFKEYNEFSKNYVPDGEDLNPKRPILPSNYKEHEKGYEAATEADIVFEKCPKACVFSSDYGVTVFVGFNSLMKWSLPDKNKGELNKGRDDKKYQMGAIDEDALSLAEEFSEQLKEIYKDKVLVLVACVHHTPISFNAVENGAGVIVNGREFVEALREKGFLVLLHGHFHANSSLSIAYDLAHGHQERGLVCLAAKDFRGQNGMFEENICTLEVDYLNGLMLYQAHQKNNTKWRCEEVQTIPLVSATRTKPGTMRFLQHVQKELLSKIEDCSEYREQWKDIWEGQGVIPTTLLLPPWPESSPCLTAYTTPPRKYDLLLFLRRKESGYEILLNYHAYKEEPLYADWDTYLMPSFKPGKYLEFIDHLKRDLLRILRSSPALTPERRVALRKQVVELIQWQSQFEQGEAKSLAINEIAGEKVFERLSPTWGTLDRMAYSILQINAFNEQHGVVAQALDVIPDFNEFNTFWTSRPEGEQRRGMVWVPLDFWEGDPKCKYCNGDVMNWLEKTIFKTGGADGRTLNDQRNITLVDRYTGKLDVAVEEIVIIESHDKEALIEKLRQVPLSGGQNRFLYRDASFAVVEIKGETLRALYDFQYKQKKKARGIWPAQTYVSTIGLNRIQALQKKLVTEGHSLFDLDGYLQVRIGGEAIDILPPIIELSQEKDLGPIWLINDGIHRLYLAKKDQSVQSIKVVLVWNLPKDSPYYAYPTTWESVLEEDGKPPQRFTKRYRNREKYRDNYRDFGAVFEIGRQGGV